MIDTSVNSLLTLSMTWSDGRELLKSTVTLETTESTTYGSVEVPHTQIFAFDGLGGVAEFELEKLGRSFELSEIVLATLVGLVQRFTRSFVARDLRILAVHTNGLTEVTSEEANEIRALPGWDPRRS